jgi:G3E family GTPase
MKIKTTILTGFLGAGKTTYLNHILKTNPNTNYAIIENEYGEQNIDHHLIIQADNSIVEMNNGCLCCSLNDGLYKLLNDLYLRQDEFDELIIEATGVADPAGIADPFLNYETVKSAFELTHTICVVDAGLIEEQLIETIEARLQITFSDILLINKTDLVSRAHVEAIKLLLKGINPFAGVLIQENGLYPELLNRLIPEKNQHQIFQKQSKASGFKLSTHLLDQPKNLLFTTHKHTNIITHSFVFNKPFNLELLNRQLVIFLTFQAKDLYRLKAIVHAANKTHKILIQSVGKRMSMEELREWSQQEELISQFVFIGKDIQATGIRKLLERCLSV